MKRKVNNLVLYEAVQKLSKESRHREVISLRTAGHSVREIAEKLKVSAMTVSRDLKEIMEDLARAEIEEAKIYQALELARLDELHASVWEKAIAGKTRYLNMAIKITQERIKLLGLDNPNTRLALMVDREIEALMTILEEILPQELYLKVLARIRKVEIVN